MLFQSGLICIPTELQKLTSSLSSISLILLSGTEIRASTSKGIVCGLRPKSTVDETATKGESYKPQSEPEANPPLLLGARAYG